MNTTIKLILYFIVFFISSCTPVQAGVCRHKPLIKKQKNGYINPLSPPYKLKKGLIVIDPGHGGDDFGTQSSSNPKYHEKSLNLVTAGFLNNYLRQMGYQTLMTRSTDVFIPLTTRASFANERLSTVFVSVHFNSAPNPEAHGIEVFYYQSDQNKTRSKDSQDFAKTVLNKVLEMTKAKSRGVKAGNFAVIRETHMPAILIEGGFLTNPEEMAKIKQPEYVQRLAWGIAQGIDTYLGKLI